ncbi:MAG: FAD-dependent oxidoreductase [Chloroflexi bacterium]|nr:FAD-dependent oxidoreductase [Chloroflexota bacterium]
MARKPQFEKLLQPIQVGNVTFRNRMMKTAANMFFTYDSNGYVNERMKLFAEALAKGGAGAVYIESPGVDGPLSVFQPNYDFYLDHDKYIPKMKELTDAIHKHGCPAFLQLLHAGPWHVGTEAIAASDWDEPEFPLAPQTPPTPKGVSTEEVQRLIDRFAAAAVRARKAGFDGVDLNTAASHFLPTFLSRVWNKRTDQYGPQSLENRARFVTETIREIKKRAGKDFNVGIVMDAAQSMPGGLTYKESQGLAKLFEKAGACSIHVRCYTWQSPVTFWPEQFLYPDSEDAPKFLDLSRKGAGGFRHAAANIKQAVSIPVITVGRLDPFIGEEILEKGEADIIGMCRTLIADTELPNKVIAGNLEDIRPCTACLSCLQAWSTLSPAYCRANPDIGQDREYNLYTPAKWKKAVLVAGGGPAGMEAARVAATRGHDVTLMTKDQWLGGSMPMASVVKGDMPEDLQKLTEWYKTQLKKLGVKTRLGKEVDASVVKEMKPDVLILATGARPAGAQIPGIDRDIVVSSTELHHTLHRSLKFVSWKKLRTATNIWMPIGKNVVIMGSGFEGCQLAEFLVKRGRKVTIVDTATMIGDGLMDYVKARLLPWLMQKGVVMLPQVKYEEITDRGLVVTMPDGKKQTLEADTIIPIVPLAPDTDLATALKGKVPEVHSIGSCREPGLIVDAIADGARVGHAI